MRYEEWGEGAGTLVLLHGLGSSADDWLLQRPALQPYFHIVAVDLRGHGLSAKPPGPYSVELFADDVAALLGLAGWGPAHVLGLSLGGLVAAQLAMAHPERVRSLVLINTFPGLWPPSPRLLRRSWHRLSSLWRPANMGQVAIRVARDLFPDPAQGRLRAEAEGRLAANDADAYGSALRAVLRFRPWPAALGRIACPTLIIAGAADRVVPYVYKERLARLIPDSRLVVIPGSGHASNVDAPDEVNRAVLEFLATVS